MIYHIKATSALQGYFKVGFEGIKARQYCGIIHHNEEDYYILPKIANDDDKNLHIFIYMLAYTNDINIKNEDLASSFNHNTNSILEIFIQINKDTMNYAILSQLKLFSSKRIKSKLGKISENDFVSLKHKLRVLVGL